MELGNNTVQGFALLCDNNGLIQEVYRDDFGFTEKESKGKLFANLIDSESRPMALNFILEVKQKKISLDYRFNVSVNNESHYLYFIGIALNGELLVVGASNQKEAVDFTNHLQQINNEQSNIIRQLLKKEAENNVSTDQENQQLFDEISQLNNDLVNLQRELTRKNAELERLNDLKNKFIGMAAHDLRNPLGVILSYSDFLIDELGDTLSKQHVDFLNNILNSSEFMLSLVEDLLDYTRIESGKIVLNRIEFDLVQKVKKNVEKSNILSAKKEIEIVFHSDTGSMSIEADENKVEQVLNNLIGNAIKFSYPKNTINVSLEQQKDKVLISVKDAGTGIKTEDQDKVFTPFNSVTGKGTSGEKGTGLGLSIVKRIVEAHNGKIWLESEVGKGTTFYVLLPC